LFVRLICVLSYPPMVPPARSVTCVSPLLLARSLSLVFFPSSHEYYILNSNSNCNFVQVITKSYALLTVIKNDNRIDFVTLFDIDIADTI